MSAVKDTNEEKLEALTEAAARTGEDTERRVTEALQTHERPVMPALFNRRERQVVQTALVIELEQGFEHRRKAIAMALESRLHSIREACNHALVMGKTELREQRMAHYAEAMQRLDQRMNKLADDFLQEADQRFERLQRYSNEGIRQREKERLEKSVENFLTTIDRMMAEFNSIVTEHIDHTEV